MNNAVPMQEVRSIRCLHLQAAARNHHVLHCYRSNPDSIPELDFVMETDGVIMEGNILRLVSAMPDGVATPRFGAFAALDC